MKTNRRVIPYLKRLAACLLLAAMLLSACKPTPEVEYVVNKGDNKAEEKINATALPTTAVQSTDSVETPNSLETTEPQAVDTASPWGESSGQAVFPDRWEGNIKTDYKEMIISADVVTAGTGSYPVELVRKSSYSNEDVLKVASYLFHDVTGWRDSVKPSREFLMEAIQYVSSSDMSEEEKNEHLDILSYELAGASVSDDDITPCTKAAELPVSAKGVAVFTSSGCGSMSLFEGNINVSTNLYGIVQPKSGWGNDPDAPEIMPLISLEEALLKAEEFFSAMGITGFALYSSDEARCANRYSTEVIDTGWQLKYIRSFGYAPSSVREYDVSSDGPFDFDNAGKWGRGVTEFSEPVKEERIVLYVSVNGIESVTMTNPYEHIATVNENVQLYDFSELTEKMKLLFTAAINNPYQSEGYYVIEEMLLTVVPQKKKDSSDYYMMPVWVLKIGDYVSIGDGLGVSPFYIPGEQVFFGWMTLAFNAIDGTRVSLPRG